jgi:Tfp pilus assembly protein FimT
MIRGFMIIELLISVVIMSVMSTVVLSANSNMSARLQTDNLAHLVALSIREAQTRALSATVPPGATTAPGYGVYFSIDGGGATQVILYTDPPTSDGGDNTYTEDTEMVSQPRVLGQGFTISGLGASAVEGQPVNKVSILFRRPRSDAIIRYGMSAGSASSPTNNASIRISSPKAGVTKTIVVTSTGQISVQ